MEPRLEPCEARRLLAFVGSGVSTVNGADFQSIDRIVPVEGGYVAAGLFGPDSNFGNGNVLQPRGLSDVYIAYNQGAKTTLLTLGGESRQRVRFKDDRADFTARPARAGEESVFGVSADVRRADEYVSDLKVGPDGKLYVAVIFRRQISLNTQNNRAQVLTATEGFEDEYFDSAVIRYDLSRGRLNSDKVIQIGGPFNDIIQEIDFDSAGNLLVAGSFERRCDFDPTRRVKQVEPLGRSDAFVAKYDTDGELVWVSSFGGDTAVQNEIETANGIAVDDDDNIYVGGTFAEEASFYRDGVRTHRDVVEADDLTDGFTMKLDGAGALQWVRAQGGSEFDGVRDVTLADGGVFSVGYFEDEADVDPTSRQTLFQVDDDDDADTDLFFSRFTSDGSLAWVKQLSGTGYEMIASATTNTSGDLVVAGSFAGRADFDPSGAQAVRTTGTSDNEDNNEGDREFAYAGFVAVYGKSNGKFRGQAQVNGAKDEDVFILDAATDAEGQLHTAGRYRVGFNVADSSLTIRPRRSVADTYREDGYALVFGSDLKPII
jgi:hypothetical protein